MDLPEAPPPQGLVMQMVMGAWVSRTISAITRLVIPDLLEEHGPSTAHELTERHGAIADPDRLHRALRACASVGVVTEDAEGRLGPTPLSETLTEKSPVSVKHLVEAFGGSWWKLWGELTDGIRTGASAPQIVFGMEYWDYCLSNPTEMAEFAAAMRSNSLASLRGVLEKCDLSDARRLVDVAGGLGHLAIALLKRYANLRAIVVDLPELIAIARERAASEDSDILQRLELVGGNMFEGLPSADVYVLKHIIHDWDDAHCGEILGRCREAIDDEGRLVCVDAVLPPLGETTGVPAKFLDVDMIAFNLGKERTEVEWRALYEKSGFDLVSITPLADNFGTSVVEGRPA